MYGDRLLLCDGPPIKQGGFFYEFSLPSATISETRFTFIHFLLSLILFLSSDLSSSLFLLCGSLPEISKAMQEIIKRKDPFQRITVSRDVALKFFEESKYKRYFIEKATQQGQAVSLYKCGELIDFCRGPHVLNTGVVWAFCFVFFSQRCLLIVLRCTDQSN